SVSRPCRRSARAPVRKRTGRIGRQGRSRRVASNASPDGGASDAVRRSERRARSRRAERSARRRRTGTRDLARPDPLRRRAEPRPRRRPRTRRRRGRHGGRDHRQPRRHRRVPHERRGSSRRAGGRLRLGRRSVHPGDVRRAARRSRLACFPPPRLVAMNLLFPSTLIWLLPALGAILALYLLKMRRDKVRVPASFLWPARTEEVRANAPIQRLRFSWLMVLQMLAMAVAIVAIARPQVRQAGLVGENTILVLDTSASMRATDVKPSRFDRAKELALGALRATKAGDRVALIDAGATPRVVFPLTNDPGSMAARIDAVEATDAEGDMGEALRLAGALAADLR
ncbi:VWA domain-containing protein, partial [bacterium]